MSILNRLRKQLDNPAILDRLTAQNKTYNPTGRYVSRTKRKQNTKSHNPEGSIIKRVKSQVKTNSYRPSGNSNNPTRVKKGVYDPVRMANLREKHKQKESFFSGFFLNA